MEALKKYRGIYFQIVLLVTMMFVLSAYSFYVGDMYKERNSDYFKVENTLIQAYKKIGIFNNKVTIRDEESLLKELDEFERKCYKISSIDQENITYRKIREDIMSYSRGGAITKSSIERGVHSFSY